MFGRTPDRSIVALTVGALVLLSGCAAASHLPPTERPMTCSTPESTLDALHAAAARADGAAYFALFTPDAVFLGTDATERWTLPQFRAYADPIFAQGKGWTYASSERHIAYSADRCMAWFDERVTNAKYGECRGTGVLVHEHAAGWRIAQYNLTKPVPNDLMEKLEKLIRETGRD